MGLIAKTSPDSMIFLRPRSRHRPRFMAISYSKFHNRMGWIADAWSALFSHLLWIEVGLVVFILVLAYIRMGLNSSQPVKWVVVLLRMFSGLWVAVIALTVWSGWRETTVPQPSLPCLVYAFPEPSPRGKEALQLEDLKSLPNKPAGCLAQVATELGKTTQLILIGRHDRRELSSAAAGQYHSNASLALDRAESLKGWLELQQGAKSNAIVLSTGPHQSGDLAEDRSVEIRAQSIRSETLNTEYLEADVSMALLALMVALSAYLATVGLFLRDRGGKLSEAITPTEHRKKILKERSELNQAEKDELKELNALADRHARNTLYRKLLILPDAPMILAAFLLFLHVFCFYPRPMLDASILLFEMAAVTFVLFHMFQWFMALRSR